MSTVKGLIAVDGNKNPILSFIDEVTNEVYSASWLTPIPMQDMGDIPLRMISASNLINTPIHTVGVGISDLTQGGTSVQLLDHIYTIKATGYTPTIGSSSHAVGTGLSDLTKGGTYAGTDLTSGTHVFRVKASGYTSTIGNPVHSVGVGLSDLTKGGSYVLTDAISSNPVFTVKIVQASTDAQTLTALQTVENREYVAGTAQISTLTPANVDIGDIFTATINGEAISYTATAATVKNVVDGLALVITNHAQGDNVTAVNTADTHITVTAKVAGTSFTITSGAVDVTPVAQISTLTPASVETGDIFTVTINGLAISYTATAPTVLNVVDGLALAITNSAQGANVTAVNTTNTKVTVTSKAAGTAFTITASGANKAAVKQVSTLTPGASIDIGDVFTATINSVDISYVATATTVKNVVDGLADAILNSAQAVNVTAVNASDTHVVVTAKVAGTAFTITSTATDVGAGTDDQTLVTATPQPNVVAGTDAQTLTVATPTPNVAAGTDDQTLTTATPTANAPIVTAQAQVFTLTPANVQIGDTFTAIINGASIPFTATAATVLNVVDGLAAAITNHAQGVYVTAVNTGNTVVTVTAKTAGTSFTCTTSVSNVTADKFQWKKNSGAYSASTAITGAEQTLGDGVTVTFAALTGHTLNDEWTMTVTSVDQFQWKKNSADYSANVAMTGASQTLSDGVTVTWGATVGHTVNDEWTITVTCVDSFKWKKDAGSYSADVPMTGSAQTLSEGVTVTFGAIVGHTVNDEWTIRAQAGTLVQAGGTKFGRLIVNGVGNTVNLRVYDGVGTDGTLLYTSDSLSAGIQTFELRCMTGLYVVLYAAVSYPDIIIAYC